MDTRSEPFGNHPDGGKITELKQGEPVPDHQMPVNEEARRILDKIPAVSRVDFILHSNMPELAEEKAFLLTKLKKDSPLTYQKYEYARCQKDYKYWLENYYNVVERIKNDAR